MRAPLSAIHVLRIILTSLYIIVNIRYGSLTASRRKRISHESRSAEALTHKYLAPREHILDLFDAFPSASALDDHTRNREADRGQGGYARSQCAKWE
jgi:hypothetical protein